jgi:two-component system, NarL family, nitrate/nitrite response regulator NarL
MSKTATKTIRILLVDDHALFRESVGRLLQAEPGLEVIAHCSSVTEALKILKSREIDLVLLDLDLGSERGADLLDNVQSLGFAGKILLVTAVVDEGDIPNLIRKGVAGIFMKHGSPELLIQGIRTAMEGRALFDQRLLKKALESAGNESGQQSRSRLSERERRVLTCIFEGLPNKQIGDRLQISESAVKACLQHLFAKTGVRTRSQLVRIALEQYRDQL